MKQRLEDLENEEESNERLRQEAKQSTERIEHLQVKLKAYGDMQEKIDELKAVNQETRGRELVVEARERDIKVELLENDLRNADRTNDRLFGLVDRIFASPTFKRTVTSNRTETGYESREDNEYDSVTGTYGKKKSGQIDETTTEEETRTDTQPDA